MSLSTKRMLVASVCAVALLAAACSSEVERCPKCGMDVTQAPRWTAGLTREDGTDLTFCSPRCLFAWKLKVGAEGQIWVTEYYSQQRLPAEQMQFVIGSDVMGPMGPALVPVKGQEAAEQFRYDHDGERTIEMAEITVELLQSLKKGS
jgi:copper chaperone NosL